MAADSRPGGAESEREPGFGNLMLGYVLLGLQPLPVAYLARVDIGASATVFVRFFLSLIFLAVIVGWRRRMLRTQQPRMLLLRGLFGGCAVLLYFTSIQLTGAARGTLLNYTYPLWANLFAAIGGQKAPRSFWLSLAVAIVGVWLVVIPEEGLGETRVGWGDIAGIVSAIFAGAAVLTIKKLRETDESLTIIASFSVFGVLMSVPFLQARDLARLPVEPVLVPALLVGLLAFFGHVFFTRGYRGVSVQQATLTSLSVPLIAAVSGVLLLGEVVSARFVIGGILIVGSLAISFVREESRRS